MNRRDILKFAALGVAGTLSWANFASDHDTVTEESLAQNDIVTVGWRIADSGTTLYHTCAKIVSCTDSTITVQAYNSSDPIFVENGVVSTLKLIYSDSELLLRQTWLTVHNYRPNGDGTQTWNIKLVGGDIGDITAGNIAYHYGLSYNSYYEVTGLSGWQL